MTKQKAAFNREGVAEVTDRCPRWVLEVSDGGVMAWDDELDQLTMSVGDLLGDDVLSAAVSRAISAALHQAWPVDLSWPLEIDGHHDRHGDLTSTSTLYDALKIELRRLLQPH